MSKTTNSGDGPDPLVEKVWQEVQELGLERHIAELEIRGYTIIPPEIAAPNRLAERLLDACLDVAEKRNGTRPNLKTATSHAPEDSKRFEGALGADQGDSPIGDLMQMLLPEDQVFEEALMNPVLLAMASYLCGYRSVLLTMGCFMKGPNKTALPLHCDAMGPSPLQANATECNITYALTDYSPEKGCTVFVPGSHKWCRKPSPDESIVIDNPRVVPVECPAGSLLCWHGNTWHGALNRRIDGIRVSIVVDLVRSHIRTGENLNGKISQEALDRNSARFAVITHQGMGQGSGDAKQASADAKRYMEVMAAYEKEIGADLLSSTSIYS